MALGMGEGACPVFCQLRPTALQREHFYGLIQQAMVQIFLNFKFKGSSVKLRLQAVTARCCKIAEVAVEGCFLGAFIIELA